MEEIEDLIWERTPESMFDNDFPSVAIAIPDEGVWNEEWKTRTAEEIQRYYFPETRPVKKNNVVLCDAAGALASVRMANEQIDLPELEVEDYGHVRDILDLGKCTLWVFSSEDGAKLLRAHRNMMDSANKNRNVLALFIETNEGNNLFGSVMDIIIGDDVLASLNDGQTDWVKITDYLNKNRIPVTEEVAEMFFGPGLNALRVVFGIRKFKRLAVNKTISIFDDMAKYFDEIAEGISGWKFQEPQWNAQLPTFSQSNAPFIFLDLEKYKYTHAQKTQLKSSEEILEAVKNASTVWDRYASALPHSITFQIAKFLRMLVDETDRFYKSLGETLYQVVSVIQEANILINAFICGFIDGFIDFIAGIFGMFGMLAKYLSTRTDYEQNKDYYKSLVQEYIENAIEAFANFDVKEFFENTFPHAAKTMKEMYGLIKNSSLPSANFSKIAYFTGYIIFAIVQIILEILLTGGAATLERLLAKGAESVKAIIKKTFGIAKDILTGLTRLLKTIKEGARNFANKVKQVVDEIFEYLERAVKKGDGIDWLSARFFRFGKDGETFRNMLRLQNRADDEWFNILSHGTPTSIIIDGIHFKAEQFAEMLLKQGYQKGTPIRLIACNTGKKKNGFAAKLAKILEAKVIAPTERIVLDDAGEFIIEHKGKFVEFN